MTTPTNSKNTPAFFAQAALSFGLALAGMIIGELYLPATGWTRAFLAMGTIFLVTSSFTLAKCVRDAQETGNVISRLDQARLERLLAEFDPYQVPHLVKAVARSDTPQSAQSAHSAQSAQFPQSQFPQSQYPQSHQPAPDPLAL